MPTIVIYTAKCPVCDKFFASFSERQLLNNVKAHALTHNISLNDSQIVIKPELYKTEGRRK